MISLLVEKTKSNHTGVCQNKLVNDNMNTFQNNLNYLLLLKNVFSKHQNSKVKLTTENRKDTSELSLKVPLTRKLSRKV